MWLSYAGEVEGRGHDEDQLAFLRDAGELRNLLLVEQPNRDYATVVVRQFFFDVWHKRLLERLVRSADDRIADIAEKALKEVSYHLRRSSDLVVRLGDGTEESRRRMQAAADELWMYTGELFAADETDELLAAQDLACNPASLRDAWTAEVSAVFARATLDVPAAQWKQQGGKQGRHGEHLGYLLAEMQFLQRAYPGAQW